MTPLPFPADALITLVGASGSGKSTWARRHFLETEIVSSDRCRALVCDDEANQQVNRHAFAIFHELLARRALLRRRSVADSTGLQPFARARIRGIGERCAVPLYAVVFLAPLPVLLRHNQARARRVPEEVLHRHAAEVERLVQSGELEREGYAAVHYLATTEPPSPPAPHPGREALPPP